MNSDQGKPGVYIPPHRRRQKIEASMDSLPVPSEIKDRNFVIMPRVVKVVEDDEEWMACGKWMWYTPEITAHIDQVWKDLQRYLSDGTFLMIKASTAAMELESRLPGVVLCYTKPEKEAIKRAAEVIRSVTKDNFILHYKVNQDTELKIAHRYGHENFAVYAYSAKGRFYKRDHLNRWILDKDRPFENELVCKSCTGDISKLGLEQLPSKADNDKIDLKYSTPFEMCGSTGWWYIKCDNSNRHQCGWTEADRIWATANKLYEKHIFERIEYRREAQVVYISCYVTNFSDDIESLISCIRKVTKNAQYMNPVYFYVYNESSNKFTRKYKLTAEEEFYEMFYHKQNLFEKLIL